jgi:hypothetical protein
MVILNASTSKKRSDKAIGGAAGPSGISAAVRCAGSRGPTDTGNSPIPIEIAAAPSPTSRGFLHQRLADAGPVRVAACVMAGIRNPSRFRTYAALALMSAKALQVEQQTGERAF